jgi:YD repeat-containing protein
VVEDQHRPQHVRRPHPHRLRRRRAGRADLDGRNNLDTTRVFDTTYCYVANTGAPCPTGSNTTNPTKALIQWSLDSLGGACSIYSYDGANRLMGVSNYGGHTYTDAYDVNGNRTSTTVDGFACCWPLAGYILTRPAWGLSVVT